MKAADSGESIKEEIHAQHAAQAIEFYSGANNLCVLPFHVLK